MPRGHLWPHVMPGSEPKPSACAQFIEPFSLVLASNYER